MGFIKEETKRSFRFNLLVVFLLCALLYILFFASLSFITRHGAEESKREKVSRAYRFLWGVAHGGAPFTT